MEQLDYQNMRMIGKNGKLKKDQINITYVSEVGMEIISVIGMER